MCLGAQVSYDNCLQALELRDVSDFCSDGLSNMDATQSDEDLLSCWVPDDERRDAWFTFIARDRGLLLNFFGRGANRTETLDQVAYGLYRGNRCSTLEEIDCIRRDAAEDDIFERLYNDLRVGQRYFIRISSRDDARGSFQFCLKTFTPVPEPEQDCRTGVLLCDKSPFSVESLEGAGQVLDEAAGSCLNGGRPGDPRSDPTETNSAWYKWTMKTSGTFTFTLTPNNDDTSEDLDFGVFFLPAGLDDCDGKVLIRCMASGENAIGGGPDNACLGPTGLAEGDPDLEEFAGCETDDNNFLAALDVLEGESYALMVNNFSRSGFGFSIEFGGSAEILGPEADFTLTTQDDFTCDKAITFEDQSVANGDPIVSYDWVFGAGADTPDAQGVGPWEVVYNSVGDRLAILTVESSRGCTVSKIEEVNIEPCCADLAPLEVAADITPLSCFDSGDGVISTIVSNGSPEFLYAIDGGDFGFESDFGELEAGIYTIDVTDIKGCEGSNTFEVTQPDEIIVMLSALMDLVELGQGTQLSSSFTPANSQVIYTWTPPDGLSCVDCPNPDVIPPGTTTYTLTLMDEDSCTGSAEITIRAEGDKIIIAPNIISLSAGDPLNGVFEVYGNNAIELVETLVVYDRWGGQLYKRENIDISTGSFEGWNGRLNNIGEKVNPGVYVWLAQVRFIDGEVINFTGDITVVD